jgi:hypothetical protein
MDHELESATSVLYAGDPHIVLFSFPPPASCAGRRDDGGVGRR